VVDEALSVRETERVVKRAGEKRQVADNKRVVVARDPNVVAAETKLMRRLGTNVKIVPKGNGKAGRLEIEYYSTEDLDRIYQMLMDQ
jgi:ParB family chromosome partitioning protein